MADQTSSQILNRILVRVYRGLLQYAVECWPWAADADLNGDQSPQQKTIEQMAAREQVLIGRIVELLSQREGALDLGTYPDNSALHYVSFDYLLGKLIADEEGLIAELQSALGPLQADAEG